MIASLRPYPAMKDSGVTWLAHLPEQWEVQRLKQVCRFAYGDALASDARRDGVVPVYGSNGRVGFHCAPNTCQPCLVVGRKGSFGKVNFSSKPVFAIDTTYYVDPRTSSANIRWLFYLLGCLRLDAVSKDSAIPGLDREDAYQRRVPVPPLLEQAAIVRFLDHAERRIRRCIQAKQKMIKLLEEQINAVIDRAVTRGLAPNVDLKPSGVGWLADVPENWEVVRLKSLVSRVTSGSRGWSNFAADSGVLFIRIGNLTRSSLDLALENSVRLRLPGHVLVEAARTRVQPDDILLSITAFIGSVAVVPTDVEEAYVSQHVACCRPRAGSANPRWLGYVLLSNVGQTHGQLSMYGGTKQGLSLDDVKNYVVLLPPRDEQDRLVKWIERATASLSTVVGSTKHQIALLREYRARLITEIITGKLDVRDAAARLPAEVNELDWLDEPEAEFTIDDLDEDGTDAVPEPIEV